MRTPKGGRKPHNRHLPLALLRHGRDPRAPPHRDQTREVLEERPRRARHGNPPALAGRRRRRALGRAARGGGAGQGHDLGCAGAVRRPYLARGARAE